MLELIDNMRLAEIVKSRQGEPAVTVETHDLIAQAASDADGHF
ncbi:hypothetical protein [Pseudomonas sp. 21LCFQ02]|nr:hypothetical protein [Pseudomonas sp. 21LCFQ02]